MVPTVVVIIGCIYGFGQHETNQDTAIVANAEGIEEIKDSQDCLEEDVHDLKEQAAIQREFYKLLRPDLWERAEEKVNNNDST